MRRVLRIIYRTLLTTVLLIVILVASLYVPPIQRWVVGKLTDYIGDRTGLEVSIGSVHVAFPLDISLGQVHVAKAPDDVIDVEQVLVDLDLTRIFSLHVGVEAIEIKGGSIRLNEMVESLRMEGQIGEIRIVADDIDLRRKTASVTDVTFDRCLLDIRLRETEEEQEEDSTESTPLPWHIDIRKVNLRRSRIALRTAGEEPLCLDAAIREMGLDAGSISFSQGTYRFGSIRVLADSLSYDTPEPVAPLGEGVPPDADHLALRDVELELDSLSSSPDTPTLTVRLRQLAFRERSGFRLDSLSGSLSLDSIGFAAEGLGLRTPHSSAQGSIHLDWDALLPGGQGRLRAEVKGSIGHEDIRTLALMPEDFAPCYPAQPLNVELLATGNADSLSLEACNMTMPGVIDVRATGSVRNVTDSIRLGADLKWDIATGDLRCASRCLGLGDMALPRMALHADTRLRNASKLTADAMLLEGRGSVHMAGSIDLEAMAYKIGIHIRSLQLHDFLPDDSLFLLTANARIAGRGTDMLSPRTVFHARTEIESLGYASWNLKDMQADVRLEKGKAMAEMSSRCDLLALEGCIDGIISGRELQAASFNMDVSHVDLHALHVVDKPLSASMVLHMDGKSDLRQTHSMAARFEAMELAVGDSMLHPLDLTLDARFTPQSIQLKALSGDLDLSLSSPQGLDSLLERADRFGAELQIQSDSLRLRQDRLRTLLPHLKMELACGRRNPLGNILRHTTGYDFRSLTACLTSSPDDGLTGSGDIQAFNTGSVLLDTIRWHLRQEQEGLTFHARVANGPKNRIVTFVSNLRASLTETGLNANLDFYDAKGKKSVDFGMALGLLDDGIHIHFAPLNPVIAYRHFALNDDNFIDLSHDGHLNALVDLLADDGTGLKLYTTPNDEALQDISLSINQFNVGELTQAIPFMPDISGFLHGDFHYMQADSAATVSTEMVVRQMAYNGVLLGDVGLNGVYFPNDDASHYVDGIVTLDGEEILLLNGRYCEQGGKGRMDGEASFRHMPFALLNAFMPDGPLTFSGHAWGDFSVDGYTESPVLNGQMRTDSLRIDADRYSVRLQIPDHEIPVSGSRLSLNRIEAYAAGKTPLVLDGSIDFSSLDRVQLDLNVRANDYQLINAPKRQGSLAYGKVFVNLGGRLWGTPDDLRMRGRIDVLGSTDVSCVLTDTPLTVDDQLADIVTFCDFNDTIAAEPTDMQHENIDVQMNVNIAETAQVHCFLSETENDYIDLQGGGDMTLTYDSQNDLQLWGRYTIGKGTMRYSLMAIPLNDFQIAQGSYVEFQGDMSNPHLNINATERLRSTVTENSMPRNVAFDVGLAISRTLEDMGLEFTLQAPEDISVQNQISAMTQEERGRVAVTMLVTGMYVTDDSDRNGGYNYANTLNAYLQSAINNIAGKAMSTVDVNFGIQSGTSETGTATTDYSFSFAKRFWGNRISIIVGGKVSSGSDAVNTGQTIIDNIAIEYRIDKSASRYVNLFYDRNYESLLEGEVTKMGGGIVFRKKADRLGELFIFRRQERRPPSERKENGQGDR